MLFSVVVFASLSALHAVEFDGQKDLLSIIWNMEKPTPVFSVSFKIKVKPEAIRGKGGIFFEMNAVEKDFPGFRGLKFFQVAGKDPEDGYTGIQANAFQNGENQKIRYNTFWNLKKSRLPLNEFVTVVFSFNGTDLAAWFNGNNLALIHKKQVFNNPECAAQYRLYFGARGGGSHAMNCEIQQIALYDKALTEEEVQKIQNGYSPREITGIIAFLPLKSDLADHLKSRKIQLKYPKKLKGQFPR